MRKRDPALNSKRRLAILKAASDCFVENGFHATSMKDVCVAAGMSPGTIYHYVRSKAEIVAWIIEADALEIRRALDGVAQAADLVEALASAIDALADAVTERELLLHAEISAEILRQPDLRRRAAAAHVADRAALAAAVRGAQRAGQVAADVDPDEAAADILSLVDGLLWEATLLGQGALRLRGQRLIGTLRKLLGRPERAA